MSEYGLDPKDFFVLLEDKDKYDVLSFLLERSGKSPLSEKWEKYGKKTCALVDFKGEKTKVVPFDIAKSTSCKSLEEYCEVQVIDYGDLVLNRKMHCDEKVKDGEGLLKLVKIEGKFLILKSWDEATMVSFAAKREGKKLNLPSFDDFPDIYPINLENFTYFPRTGDIEDGASIYFNRYCKDQGLDDKEILNKHSFDWLRRFKDIDETFEGHLLIKDECPEAFLKAFYSLWSPLCITPEECKIFYENCPSTLGFDCFEKWNNSVRSVLKEYSKKNATLDDFYKILVYSHFKLIREVSFAALESVLKYKKTKVKKWMKKWNNEKDVEGLFHLIADCPKEELDGAMRHLWEKCDTFELKKKFADLELEGSEKYVKEWIDDCLGEIKTQETLK